MHDSGLRALIGTKVRKAVKSKESNSLEMEEFDALGDSLRNDCGWKTSAVQSHKVFPEIICEQVSLSEIVNIEDTSNN